MTKFFDQNITLNDITDAASLRTAHNIQTLPLNPGGNGSSVHYFFPFIIVFAVSIANK